MSEYTVKPLNPNSWMDFVRLAEHHNGVLWLLVFYPQDTDGEKVSASYLYNGTRSLFEQAGFEYSRKKGTKHCVMTKLVPR